MNLDFWIGFFAGAIVIVAAVLIIEGVSEYIQKKRRKIKDEWK